MTMNETMGTTYSIEEMRGTIVIHQRTKPLEDITELFGSDHILPATFGGKQSLGTIN